MPLLLPLLASLMFAQGPLAKLSTIHEDVPQTLAENGWKVTVGRTYLPGFEQHRAWPFDFVCHCSKLDGSSTRLVFRDKFTTGETFHPLHIAPDGTVTGSVYPGKLLIVGPKDEPGKPGQGERVDIPGLEKNEGTELLHANAAGLVARPDRSNVVVPIYFIPMAEGKPDAGKAVELCRRDSRETHIHYSGFQVTDKWIVWDSGSYEVATGKIRKRVAESGVITDRAIDGDLIVTQRSATVDRKAVHEIVSIDLKTAAPKVRQPVASNCLFLAVHDGVAYVLNPIPFKAGEREQRAELRALDIAEQVEPLSKTDVAMPAAIHSKIRITPKGFRYQGLSAEWVKK